MKPSQKYVTYIQCSRKDLWQALIDPEFTQNYFFGTKITTDFKVGSEITYLMENGEAAIAGEILAVEPETSLKFTFRGNQLDDGSREPYSHVLYEIEETDNAMKLTITHDAFETENQTYQSVSGGWPQIIASLKTLLETGKSLNI